MPQSVHTHSDERVVDLSGQGRTRIRGVRLVFSKLTFSIGEGLQKKNGATNLGAATAAKMNIAIKTFIAATPLSSPSQQPNLSRTAAGRVACAISRG